MNFEEKYDNPKAWRRGILKIGLAGWDINIFKQQVVQD